MHIFSPKKQGPEKASLQSTKKYTFYKSWGFWWKTFLSLALIGFLSIAGIFAWFARDLPSPENLTNRTIAQSTKIYDRTGKHLLYEIHGEEKRTEIPFSQMPDTLKYATIALEDQNFYTNHGIEITAIIRAGLADLLHRSATQGASTITQQLVKQTILSSKKTLSRKIREAILSIEINQKYSKNKILGMYLNQIPYGSNAYGVEAAAQTFFGKHASELTLDESALIASLPQAPSHFSPYGNYTKALKTRQEYALDQMAKLGYITKQQAKTAKKIDVFSKIKPFSEKISAPHFVMYIKDYLEKKYGEQKIEQGGLSVYTTLDWEKQQLAEQAIKKGAEKNAKIWGASNAALVAMDPKTGQILAMVGSKNYFDKSIDGQVNVAIRPRQPGSSFKPYVYLTAFEKGYTPETQIWDTNTNFSTEDGKIYDPRNYDGKNIGLTHMKNALAMSLNVPAVKTLYLAGIKDSIKTAKEMGITTLNHPDRYGLSLVLGGGEVTLLDHVNAYSTFATGGIHHKTVSILKIVDSSGNILEQYKNSPGEKIVDKKYVAMIDYILSTNSLRAPVFGVNNPLRFDDRPVAAKTGTTNAWRDGWTIGYTPSLVAGVWAGNDNNSPMRAGADGSYVASPIWKDFMEKALKNYNIEHFPKYKKEDTGKDIIDGKLNIKKEFKVCKIPGTKHDYCLANNICPDNKIEKKKFSNIHTILYYVNRNDPLGAQPKNPKDDPQYKNWEKGVQKWLKDNKSSSNIPPTKDCKESDFKKYKPSIKIIIPSNNQIVTTSSLPIKANISADYGVKNITIQINGNKIHSTNNNSLNYTYSIPEKEKHTTLNIKISLEDNNENTTSDNLSIQTNIP